jgi:type I restriction enzyme S subunit
MAHGTIGRVAFVREAADNWTVDGQIMVLRPKRDSIVGRYIYDWMSRAESKRLLVNMEKGGAFDELRGQTHIYRDDVASIPLLVPPVSEQRKIAAILSSVDDAIDATQAVIDQLQVVKNATMVELLTRGLPGRHTRFKQTEIGDVPERWALCSIDDLGLPGQSVVRTGPFGSSMKTKDFRPCGVQVLTIQSLGEGEILHGGLFFVDEEKAAELAEYKVRVNDVVFSRVADIGRCAAIGEGEAGWLISPNLSRIRLDAQKADARFLMYLITMGEVVRRQVEMVAGNAGRPVITSTTLKNLRLPLPSIEEQHAIAAAGRELEARVGAEVRALEALRTVKVALMSVLLTGEVRVTPDKEPT